MTSDFDAVVDGHICLDIHPDLRGADRESFEKIFLPGRLVAAGPVSYSTGGAVSNTGLALNRLGIVTWLVGKVGDDLFGQALCQVMAPHGKDLTEGLIIDASASTSYTIIINYPGVDRIFLHSPGAEEILFMLRRATYQELCRTAKGSDILPLITPQLLSDLGQELIAMGAGIVGLKLGYRCMYLRTGDQPQVDSMGRARPSNPDAWARKELWAPCFKVAVAGTTGSGDGTIAGFLSALLRGLSVEQALLMAVAVGACNVEAIDALSGIRTWEDTVQRIATGWERQLLELDAPGWQFDPTSSLWRGPCA